MKPVGNEVHTEAHMERKEKTASLADAIRPIEDGAHVAIGGSALHSHPMALVRELIRQEKRDLVIIGEIQGIEADLLCGAGVVRRIESAGVGLERFGQARNFRRAVEAGDVSMRDFTDTMAMDRIRAAGDAMPFWPVSHLDGTDIARYLPDDLVEITCPFTGRRLQAMRPAVIDYALIHTSHADRYGNAMFPTRGLMPNGQDVTLSRAAKHTIISVEKLVDPEVIKKNAHRVHIPGFRVDSVVEAPFGAHPSSALDFYDFDSSHLEAYVESSKSPAGFSEYLSEYLGATENDYLEKVGVEALLKIRKVVTW